MNIDIFRAQQIDLISIIYHHTKVMTNYNLTFCTGFRNTSQHSYAVYQISLNSLYFNSYAAIEKNNAHTVKPV